MPSDDAGEQANQPVVTPRTVNRMAVANPRVRALAQTNVLSKDKYEITSLTGEFKRGDASKYDSYDTHMKIKLDDSVQGGDRLVYGIQYEYKDLNGTYQNWLGSTGENTPQTVDIMHEGVNIGTMTLNPYTMSAKSTNPDFEVDSLDGAKTILNNQTTKPVEIVFNDNINNLKNVEITLDNSFVQRDEATIYQNTDYNYFYVDKDSKSPNVVKNNDGTFVKLPKGFVVNNEAQNLDVLYHAKEKESQVEKNNLDNFENVWRIQTRTYETDKNGDEFLRTDPNLSTWVAVAPPKQPIKSFTTTVTIPKELTKYADFSYKDNSEAQYPQKSGSKGSSMFNPLTTDGDVYTGWTRNVTNSTNDNWERDVKETTNADGDTVYTITYKTKDGSYEELSKSTMGMVYYKLKEELPHSEKQTFEEANQNPANSKWSIPEWDKALAETPIEFHSEGQIKNDAGEEDTISRDSKFAKEFYVIRNVQVKDASDGAVRVTADKERTETVPHSETIPFETITRENKNLPKGTRNVIQKGINGQRTWDEQIKYVNDEEVSRTVANEVNVPKQDEIIEVGTGVVDKTITTKDKEIPFETITRENKDLPEGTRNVVQKGITGLERTTTTQPTLNGQPNGKATSTTETIRDKQDEIIEVGTGVVGENVTVKDKETPFKTITRENPNLPKGTRNVIQQGQNGIDRTTTTQKTLNGEVQGNPTSKTVNVQKKIDEIIEVGTGIVDNKVTVTKDEIPFKTITRENPNLPEGTRNVIQDGQNGERTTTTTQPTLNGQPNGKPTVTSSITKEKQDQIIEVGIGKIGEHKDVQERELPFNTIERVNPELPQGERKVIQEGSTGLERTITTSKTLNGVPTEITNRDVEVVKEAQDRIIEVGSGVSGQNVTVKETVKPFEHITRDNPNLPEGTQRIVQQGKDGIVRTTTTETTYNGKVTNTNTVSEEVQPRIDEIVEIGTGKLGYDVTDVPNEIPHDTIRRDNPNLPKGETRVVQDGHVGHTITRTITPTLNGKPYGKPIVTTIVIDFAKDTIIEIGTKEKEASIDNNGNNDNNRPDQSQDKTVDGSVTDNHKVNSKVTIDNQAPQQNRVNVVEKADGETVVTVMPKTSVSNKHNGQVVDAPHVSSQDQNNNNTTVKHEKELPETGESDTNKTGILAMIAAIFGFGLLKTRRKNTKSNE